MSEYQPYDDLAHCSSHNYHSGKWDPAALLMKAFAPILNQSCFLEPLVVEDNYHMLEVGTASSEMDTALVADNQTLLLAENEDLGVPIVVKQRVHVDGTPVVYNRQREENSL